MTSGAKLLTGVAAVLLLGWLHHAPLGNGEAEAERLESRARTVVAATELRNIDMHIERDPIARRAILSGPADDFQRNGMGSFKGLTQRVDDVPGIRQVHWADEPGSPSFILPMLAETLLLLLAAYALGLALAWVMFRSREGRYA